MTKIQRICHGRMSAQASNQSHVKPVFRAFQVSGDRTLMDEVRILGADQKERSLWVRDWFSGCHSFKH